MPAGGPDSPGLLRPELVAALANGVVVMVVASVLVYLTGAVPTNEVVRGRAITPFEHALGSAARASLPALFVAPLAAVVIWRTRTHATRYVTGESRGWRAVLDGGVLGALIPAALLFPAALIRLSPFSPGDIGPSQVVITMLGAVAIGFVIGAGCALILRQVAIMVLWVAGPMTRSSS